ncbi:MAG: hypothetical protein ACRD30_04825 [Bryobacteraceae bacterium]
MKSLLTAVLLCAAVFCGSAEAQSPPLARCFKVNRLLKMDGDHYWADWTNACPYIIDSVYVKVRFSDKARSQLGDGLWALHFISPGAHRVTRLTAPASVPHFEFVSVRRITTNLLEALR